ncbi:MAG TPA: Na+/H+ antiporter NhaA [Ignavibacteriaceae bacterium]|nr:Na+/H+ antiporter NhaA [Ignavibacteriaceae bacterium]
MEATNPVPPIEKIFQPFKAFAKVEASSGIVLIFCTIIALVWANSGFSESYTGLWHTNITIGIGNYNLSYNLHYWINDGLMAVFFFVVGLEIKREFLVGELSTAKQAALPAIAALGGMIIPALIYTLFNLNGKGEAGWGIPMATDIAFVIGLMALLGSHVPSNLKIFITALAIADDIGAVLVIAVFYTSELSVSALLVAGGILLILFVLNRLGVRNLLVYTVLGLFLWLAFLKSGIHATVAGVLFAFIVPATARYNTKEFLMNGKDLLKEFDEQGKEGMNVLANEERQNIVQTLESNCAKVLTPLQRFEHNLNPWVSFVIMPVFALANAGVLLQENFFSALINEISLGIITGLFIGKQIGIFIFSWLAVKLNIAELPANVNWKQIYGTGILAGIGFTMSLFITNLAFTGEELSNVAKVGILSASLISGIAGYLLLRFSASRNIQKEVSV